MNFQPCPFCGSDFVYVEQMDGKYGYYYVICGTCNGSGPPEEDISGAIIEWNEREGHHASTS